jgi:hypothetical protein
MRIVLENEMERRLWPILLAAHYKWEKNYGVSIRGQMEWYFFELYKDETDKLIEAEVQRRISEEYGDLDILGVSKEMYVAQALFNFDDELFCWGKDEYEYFIRDAEDEYDSIRGDFEDSMETIPEDVKEQLASFYYNFFNAPESLTVEHNREGIQSGY